MDNFDKTFNRMSRWIVGMWAVGAILSTSLIVAIIWGIVKVVNGVF